MNFPGRSSRACFPNGFDWRDEAVTAAGQRLDVSRSLWRIPKRFPNPRNRIVQAVIEVDKCVSGPYFRAQLCARDELTRAHHQGGECLKRLTLETELLPLP